MILLWQLQTSTPLQWLLGKQKPMYW